MKGIYINTPGLMTSVQDDGRFGYQWSGICPSGAMDMHSLRLANILVGNDMDEAGLEITVIGPDITFQVDEVIAITGADLSPALDGMPVSMYRAVAVKAGQRLTFGPRKTGCRSYIAFAGGFDIEPLYNSRSTLLRIGMGGKDGRVLKNGDEIGLRAPRADLPHISARTVPAEDLSRDHVTLRVIMGPQDYLFTEKGIETFLSEKGYTVGNLYNRQGYRLEGEEIEPIKSGSIVSDGIAKGAIQIPPNGLPIILLSERNSTGGYMKIANVITVDLPKIGQCLMGAKVYFKAVSVTEAQTLIAEEMEYLETLKKQLDEIKPPPCRKYRATVGGEVYSLSIEEIE